MRPLDKMCILDGYNLLHAYDIINKIKPLELAREHLIQQAINYQISSNKVVVVVFDGSNYVDSSIPHEKNTPYFKVIFSRKGFNADGAIISIVRKEKHKKNYSLTVVTGDHLLAEIVIDCGGFVISPSLFKRELMCSNDNHSAKKKNSENFSYKPFKDISL